MQPRRTSHGRSFGFVFYVLLLAFGGLALYRQEAIADWFRLRNYSPEAPIAALADQTGLTDHARHLFYINHPGLEDKPSFRSNCPDYGEQTIVIGCYLGGQRGIHLLKVSDERLAGVEQVTAAHEMLHAAYERLSRSEKKKVNDLLQNYANDALQDERIKAVLKGYETTEPGEQLNEMHSIFGTEIAELPGELEEYYGKYFVRRATVVNYAQHYQEAFTGRQTAIKQYDSQLASQSKQIQSNTKELKAREQQIDDMRQALDDNRDSGNIEAYNAGVDPFNAKVREYNELLVATKSLIERYNSLVEQRNAIAAQTVELQQAINSSSLPQSQQ